MNEWDNERSKRWLVIGLILTLLTTLVSAACFGPKGFFVFVVCLWIMAIKAFDYMGES